MPEFIGVYIKEATFPKKEIMCLYQFHQLQNNEIDLIKCS